MLLEAGVAHPASVRDRAEELKADMAKINKNSASRISLAENLLEFLKNSEEVKKILIFRIAFSYVMV